MRSSIAIRGVYDICAVTKEAQYVIITKTESISEAGSKK